MRPTPKRWSRINETVPVLLDELHGLAKLSSEKARQFAASRDLSDAFIDLSTSIESRKVDVLLGLQNLPEPESTEERNKLSEAAENLGDEIERLRGVKNAIADELSKGC